mmetsp:Transcript_29103/g.100378  ORF Transcript_29103/g.100378 Transcript_29103/m.100378 type:complete len:245 (+) Transcript_29103:217-951(+)
MTGATTALGAAATLGIGAALGGGGARGAGAAGANAATGAIFAAGGAGTAGANFAMGGAVAAGGAVATGGTVAAGWAFAAAGAAAGGALAAGGAAAGCAWPKKNHGFSTGAGVSAIFASATSTYNARWSRRWVRVTAAAVGGGGGALVTATSNIALDKTAPRRKLRKYPFASGTNVSVSRMGMGGKSSGDPAAPSGAAASYVVAARAAPRASLCEGTTKPPHPDRPSRKSVHGAMVPTAPGPGLA